MVTIPGYEIENLIYKGKAYAIYRGVREKDDQPVILKRSRIETSQPNLYENEYAILRSLTGEGIVRVLDLVDQQDISVLIYEDIGADSLDNLMEKSNFSMTERLSIATGITAALVRVHHDGFIHKRINPSNILYCPDTGRIQLINFEFATELIAGELYSDGSEVIQKTMAYISPEQTGKMNRPLDYRSDLYSLGATLYELFSGKRIFQTGDILEFVHSHIAVIPLPPHVVDSMIPPTLANIIMKLLAKEAEDRYLCAAGLKYDLVVCLEQYKKTRRIDPFILQERDISDQFRISGRLYGRTEEMNVVKTALKRSQAGSMELVLVTGYAGIGKTAMVREALQQITTDQAEVAVHLGIGRFDRFHRDTPYSAITKVARDVVRQILAQTDEAVKNWCKILTKAFGRNGRVIADIIPEIEIIIGSQPEVPLLGPLEAQNRFNLVFQNFVRALSGPDHPLVIFLDDIQYADAASSRLIETILTDDGLHHFLGIATYRDDETNSDHPIHATLDALKLQSVRLTWLQMESLGFESVKSLIADSLHTDKVRVSGLSALTLQKTDGNPFFIGMFLKTLRSENLLTFDSSRGQWQWSISRINKLESTDNVVDLLVQKIKRLSENTQEILGWASCIGIEFDLSAFIAISGIDATEIGKFFREAIQEGLLLVVEPFYQQTRGNVSSPKEVQGSYRFTHDRIRQAVYSSMDAIQKQHCHAKIGLYLLQNLTETEQSKELFSIVNHLNAGNKKTVTVVNREKLARLNLYAGLKAKSAAAFSPAFKYFQNGMLVIGKNCWEDNYQLTKDLYEKAAETAYLCGYYGDMERLAEELLQHANSLLDTINVHETVINSYIARYQLEKAITTALDMLLKLDVNLPSVHP
jgi:serine/threonine protein kinase